MTFEDTVGELNSAYFFREFTYSRNTFRPTPRGELELADKVVWLDDLLIVSQIKERNAPVGTAPDRERRWFADEVLKKATRQIRDTLGYLKGFPQIEVTNNRGHRFNLTTTQISHLHKLVIYHPNDLLPSECRSRKHHTSRTAGLIHLIGSADYLTILSTLVTPAEISEYLSFRETLANRWPDAMLAVSERAIVGQYIRNLPQELPGARFEAYVDVVQQTVKDWDISPIIRLFMDRKNTRGPKEADYRILKELARLNRAQMAEFRKRWQFSMKKALADEFSVPNRFTASNGCGFVFIPLRRQDLPNRHNALINFTRLNKYDQKLDRCIGLSFIAEGRGDWCDVQWCRMERAWTECPDLDTLLKQNYPFGPMRESRIERYGLPNKLLE